MSLLSRRVKQVRRAIRLLLLMILTIGVITACSGQLSQKTASPQPQQPSADCRMVKHAVGETCVPANPQRVIVLGNTELDNVLALGVKPVGVAMAFAPGHVKEKLAGVEDVALYPPNLEKILLLKPDLILGSKYLGDVYPQLSQIAPTVFDEGSTSGTWKQQLMLYAEALGKTQVAQQLMNDYNARLEKFKAQMGEQLKQTEVSVLNIRPTLVRLYRKNTFCGTILEDAGLSRPPDPYKDLPIVDINKERLRDIDADVLFVWTYDDEMLSREPGAQTALKQLKGDPLWSQLSAVQKGKVYEVPGYWIGAGPLSANLVIDDLFKYLVGEG